MLTKSTIAPAIIVGVTLGALAATAKTWNLTFHIVQVTVVRLLTEAGLQSIGLAAIYSIGSSEEPRHRRLQ